VSKHAIMYRKYVVKIYASVFIRSVIIAFIKKGSSNLHTALLVLNINYNYITRRDSIILEKIKLRYDPFDIYVIFHEYFHSCFNRLLHSSQTVVKNLAFTTRQKEVSGGGRVGEVNSPS